MKKFKILAFAISLTMLSGQSVFGKEILNSSSSTNKYATASTTNQWTYSNGCWYYYSSNGIKHTGWLLDGGTWYYLNKDGTLKTGWLKYGNDWYYFNSNGSLRTGWLNEGNTWYYLNSDGTLRTGWLKDGNNWYFLNSDGTLKSGWLNLNNTTYYLDESGAMKTGWIMVDNKNYYMNDDGSMVKNAVIDNKEIGADGFVTVIYSYITKGYNNTLDYYVNLQDKIGKPEIYDDTVPSKFRRASKDEIINFINPKNFVDNKTFKYMFMKLSYTEGITADQLNQILKDKGYLQNKGDIFLQAGRQANVNPIYLISHALQETANGTSKLGSGIDVDKIYSREKATDDKGNTIYKKVLQKEVPKKTVYNVYGIGAFIDDAVFWGANSAYKNGWFSIDDAIIGGAKWISDEYISKGQDTLYKMRWDLEYKESPWTNLHQYATDVAWAKAQTYRIKALVDKMTAPTIVFEIPSFKEN